MPYGLISVNSPRHLQPINYSSKNQLCLRHTTARLVPALYLRGDVVNTGAPTLTLLASTNKEAHIGIPAKQLAQMNKETEWTLRVGNQSYNATLLNPRRSRRHGLSHRKTPIQPATNR